MAGSLIATIVATEYWNGIENGNVNMQELQRAIDGHQLVKKLDTRALTSIVRAVSGTDKDRFIDKIRQTITKSQT